MIHIIKASYPPLALLEQQEVIENTLLERKEKFKWRTEHYSDPIKEELSVLYHNKCAFCEQKLTKSNTPQKFTVEHYRPKSIYWWLGNEWTNLFPTCEKCNDNKKDDFPLLFERKRVLLAPVKDGTLSRAQCLATSGELLAEKPTILHPEIDHPEDFFEFLADGTVKAKEGLDNWNKSRANYMIAKFLGIQSLEEKRKKYIDSLQADFVRTVVNFLTIMQGNTATNRELKLGFYSFLEKVFTSNNYDREFSRLGHFMSNNFEAFFIDTLPKNFPTKTLREILQKAIILFLKEKTNNTT